MKVLLCAQNDFANLGYTLYCNLKYINCQADFCKLSVRGFYSNANIDICSLKDVRQRIKKYDVIIFMHSGRNLLFRYAKNRCHTCYPRIIKEIKKYKKDKVFAVFHGGSVYRRHYKEINEMINPWMDVTFTQTYDLLNLGAKNEKWILAPVDLSAYKCDIHVSSPLKIAHYPSSPGKKNSSMINEVLFSLQKENANLFTYHYSDQVLPHYDNLKRVKDCDIYIDHQQFTLDSCPYGEFGIAAKEAAAMSKIVVTCTKSLKRYKKEYGSFVPFISNSKKDLFKIIKDLIHMEPDQIRKLKRKNRRWVEKCHSYKFIGSKLYGVLKKELSKKRSLKK